MQIPAYIFVLVTPNKKLCIRPSYPSDLFAYHKTVNNAVPQKLGGGGKGGVYYGSAAPTVRQTLVSRRGATHKVCHLAAGKGPDRAAGPDPEDQRLGGPTTR